MLKFTKYSVLFSDTKENLDTTNNSDINTPKIELSDNCPINDVKTLKTLAACIELLRKAAWNNGKEVDAQDIHQKTTFLHSKLNESLKNTMKIKKVRYV